MNKNIEADIKCPSCGSLDTTVDKATPDKRRNICLDCGKAWERPNRRMTIGEAAKQRFIEISKRDNCDPHEPIITCGDHGLLHEIAQLSGRRGDDHAWNCTARMIRGIARSPLFKMVGYASYPGMRGYGRVACYKLKTPEEIEAEKRAKKIMESPRVKASLERLDATLERYENLRTRDKR